VIIIMQHVVAYRRMLASLYCASKLYHIPMHIVYLVSVTADLERSSEYSVRVHAMTVNGTGPPTPWIVVETFTHDLDGKTASLPSIYRYFSDILEFGLLI